MKRTTQAILVFAIAGLLLTFAANSTGQDSDDAAIADLAGAIQELQPATNDTRATRLARIFFVAANESALDPRLLIAIAMRESSLLEEIETGGARGSLGEIGLLQTHGIAIRYRPTECTRSLEWRDRPNRQAACQILTGTRFLAAVREQCGGSWWRWVGSYGASRCMTEREARTHRSTHRARRYYLAIGGTDWE